MGTTSEPAINIIIDTRSIFQDNPNLKRELLAYFPVDVKINQKYKDIIFQWSTGNNRNRGPSFARSHYTMFIQQLFAGEEGSEEFFKKIE